MMACGLDSCRRNQQLSRETWVRDVGKLGDFRFFIGVDEGNPLETVSRPWEFDEEYLDVPDDKEHILEKSVKILEWALDHDYDMILKVDNDTFLNIPELAKQDYTSYDYVGAAVGSMGDFYAETNAYSFIQGSAQWLSRKAAKIVIREAVPVMHWAMPFLMRYNGLICPYPHSEDLWIGQVLGPRINSGDIKVLTDQRYTNGSLTYHFALDKAKHDMVAWMHGLYNARGDQEKMAQVHRERINEI